MTLNPNLPKMDLNKYEQYISKSLTAGTEGKSGMAKAEIVMKNMSHNMKVFVKQVHTYFTERSKPEAGQTVGHRKVMTNARVINSIDKKLSKLEGNIDTVGDVTQRETFLREAIREAKAIIGTFEEAGVPKTDVENLQAQLGVLDNKLKGLSNKGKKAQDAGNEPLLNLKKRETAKPEPKAVAGRHDNTPNTLAKTEQRPVDQPSKRGLNDREGRGFEGEVNLSQTQLAEGPNKQPSVEEKVEVTPLPGLSPEGEVGLAEVPKEVAGRHAEASKTLTKAEQRPVDQASKGPLSERVVRGLPGSKDDFGLQMRRAKEEKTASFTAEDAAGVKVRDKFRKQVQGLVAEKTAKKQKVAETTRISSREMMIKSNVDSALNDLIRVVLSDATFELALMVDVGTPINPHLMDSDDLKVLKEFKTVAKEDLQQVKETTNQIIKIINNNLENNEKIVTSQDFLKAYTRVLEVASKLL